MFDSFPDVSGNNVVWSGGYESDREIFLYNGKEIIQLTNNNRFDASPRISGNNIVWQSGVYEKALFFYNGKETIQLTDNQSLNGSYQIFGNNVVWQRIDSNSNSEIFFYNGKETIQLTNNNRFDSSPQISGDNIVWSSGFGKDEKEFYYNSEIFLYNGSETIQLTDNDVPDLYPKIDGNRIVWQRFEQSETKTPSVSIMLATVDDTKSSSKSYNDRVAYPAGNRNQKLVTSSTIIILGLIFLVWLKKLQVKCSMIDGK